MKMRFSRAEAEYIVKSPETDLMLTKIGITLVGYLDHDTQEIEVTASDADLQDFLDTLRDDYIWKAQRLSNPALLQSMAEKFLPDFDSITPMNFG